MKTIIITTVPYRAHQIALSAIALFAIVAAALLMLPSVHAQTAEPGLTEAEQIALEGLKNTAIAGGLRGAQTQIEVIVGNIIKAALSLVGVIFLLLMIYGGYRWMTAQGAPDQVKKAQDIIKAAIIGIAIVALAFAIANFVIGRLATATT